MRVPMLVLGAACVAIGLAPVFFWPAVARARAAWQPDLANDVPAPLVALGSVQLAVALAALAIAGRVVALWRRVRRNGLSRAVTWDCGYAAPTPRMQYTAGSFAGIITVGSRGFCARNVTRIRRRKRFPSQRQLRGAHTGDGAGTRG